jgi:hypothetical protein
LKDIRSIYKWLLIIINGYYMLLLQYITQLFLTVEVGATCASGESDWVSFDMAQSSETKISQSTSKEKNLGSLQQFKMMKYDACDEC